MAGKKFFNWMAVGVFFTCCVLYYSLVGPFSGTFFQQTRTFFYSAGYLQETFFGIGGGAYILGDFVSQFFVGNAAFVVIAAIFCACCFWLLCRLCAYQNPALAPLSMIPAAALAVQHLGMHPFSAPAAAYFAALSALFLRHKIKEEKGRFIFSITMAAMLFPLFGPAATLFAAVVLVEEAFSAAKLTDFLKYLSVPAVVVAIAVAAWQTGLSASALYPLRYKYYYSEEFASLAVNGIPWIGTVAVVLIAASLRKMKGKGLNIVAAAISLAVAIFMVVHLTERYAGKSEQGFKELSVLSSRQDWDGVIEKCNSLKHSNMMFRNFQNLAFAHKGVLADQLFRYPCTDGSAVVINVDGKAIYQRGVVSDIYLEMGSICTAQRYAFEALECMGNHSPQMLKRLVVTNLIYGHYPVAERYLKMLSATIFYRKWAEEYVEFLYNDDLVDSDPFLGPKRRCVAHSDNYVYDLEGELNAALEASPHHAGTMQYLGALYLLSGDTEGFIGFLERFYGTDALPEVLPVYFQQAVLAYYYGYPESEEKTAEYNISRQQQEAFQTWLAAKVKDKTSLWSFLYNRHR